MTLYTLIPAAFSFLFSFAAIFFCWKIFPKLKLMDHPHEYGLHRAPIPYSAGIVFPLVFIVSAFLFIDITKPIAGVIFAALLITFVSFMDDRIRLSPLLRLFVQILAGIIIVFAGIKIQLIKNPFGAPIMLDAISFNFLGQQIWLFSALAIIAWLVLMMNVMNWLDGIPGLSSGISTIAQISLFILSTRQFNAVDQSAVITISSVLAASTLAFLFFDFYPPKLLMGDTGSMFLGLMLGVLSILAGGKLATAILIMGFPVIDAFWVIIGRVIKKGSPLKGDFSHFHHQLLKVGFSERKALIFNYFFCVIFAAIALVLNTTSAKAIAFTAVFIAMGAIRIGVSLKVSK